MPKTIITKDRMQAKGLHTRSHSRMVEGILPPAKFAKSVTGKLAKGHLTE